MNKIDKNIMELVLAELRGRRPHGATCVIATIYFIGESLKCTCDDIFLVHVHMESFHWSMLCHLIGTLSQQTFNK